jgi:purine-binding chemotaxis protein CheW
MASAEQLPVESAESATAEDLDNETVEKHLIFTILGRLYSFPSRHISEIALFDTVYPLPLMPPYVLGVINRYSVPYALFDIGLLLYQRPGIRKKILVLKDDIDRIAFLIDDVMGIADISSGSFFETERSAGGDDLTDAVCSSFKWNGDNVFVLDVRKILDHVTVTEA